MKREKSGLQVPLPHCSHFSLDQSRYDLSMKKPLTFDTCKIKREVGVSSQENHIEK